MSRRKIVELPSTDVEQVSTSEHTCCEKISETAYAKWEAAGCPCGDGVDFWLQAEAEVAADKVSESEPSEA